MSLSFNTGGVNFSGAIKSTGLQLINANGTPTVDLSNLSANVSNLQTLTTTHSSQINSLQSLTNTHTSQISTINNTLTTLKSIADFQNYANTVTANINYIESEIDQLQANCVTLAQIIQQTSANLSSIEATNVYALNQSISTERTARQSDISNVTTLINTETIQRQSDVANLNTAITTEASARVSDIANLSTSINSVIASQIASINSNVSSLSTSVNSTLSSQISALQAQETSDISNVNASITSLSSDVYSALSSNVSSLTTLINNEASVRQANVATLTSLIASEASTRASAVSTVTSLINTEISDRQNAVSSLNTSLTNTINSTSSALYSAISSNISAVNSSITSTNSALASNVSTLNSSISSLSSSKFDKSGGNIDGNVSVSGGISSGNSSIYASLLNGTLQISDGDNVMTITPTQISVVTPSNVAGTTQFTPFNLSNLSSGSSSGLNLVVSSTKYAETYTQILLNFEGSDFTDESYYKRSPTNSTLQGVLSNANSKFGTKSWYWNNQPANASSLKYDIPQIGMQDFTFEGWFKADVNNYNTMFSIANNGYKELYFYMVNSTTFNLDIDNNNMFNIGGVTIGTTNWNHFALTRYNNKFYVFLNGTKYGGPNNSTYYLCSRTANFFNNHTTDTCWRGYADSVRLTIGKAIWTASFTPPTTAYSLSDSLPTSAKGDIITDGVSTFVCTSASSQSFIKVA